MKRLVVTALCFFISAPSWGAIARVGVSSQGTANTTSVSVTRSAGSTSNLYTVYCGGNGGTLSISNTTTAFTWTNVLGGQMHNGTTTEAMFWAVPSTVASQTITCTQTSGSFVLLLLDEWSGTNTVTPIDVSSGTLNTLTTCATVGTMSVNNDAMVCGAVDTITAVGNINASLATVGANDLSGDWTEWRINSGTGSGSTITAAWTGTAAGALCITAGILPSGGAAAANTCAPPFCGVVGE